MFYTYAYLREDGTPYYIGKGCGDRVNAKHRFKLPPVERRLILKEGLTEEEAHRHEVYLISVLGRKDKGTGILRNLTDGGEGVTGLKHSIITRNKIKVKRQKQIFTPEVIALRNKSISEGRKGVEVSYENKKKVRSRYSFTFINDDGREETTDLLPEFCRKHNLIETNIYKVTKGERKSCSGWRLKQ